MWLDTPRNSNLQNNLEESSNHFELDEIFEENDN